jgi:hypothetical protein
MKKSESREAKQNREKIEAFAAQFIPPLKVVATQQIDFQPVRNGFAASCWDDDRKIGVTAIAWGAKGFKAFVECVPDKQDADAPAEIGKKFAAFLKEY